MSHKHKRKTTTTRLQGLQTEQVIKSYIFPKEITEENIQMSVQKIVTTAVEDIERNAPTNTPSEGLPPHNWK